MNRLQALIENWTPAAAAALLVLCCAAGASAQRTIHLPDDFVLKIGASYDRGDFGGLETSRAFFVPVTLRYMARRFDLSATPSYARVDTAAGVRLIEGIPTPTGETTPAERTSGLGDTVIRSRVFLLHDYGDSPFPAITPFVKVKIPTADEQLRLGTGKADYGLGLELDKQIANALLFGDVSYTVVGKVQDLDFRNRVGASFGMAYGVSNRVTVSGLVDWRQSILEGNPNPAEAVGIVSLRLARSVTVSPHVFVGLTDSSPDYGGGVELAFRFGLL